MKKEECNHFHILTNNIKRYVKRAGIGIVTFSLGTATLICINDEKANTIVPCKVVTINEASASGEMGVTYTLDAVERLDYADLQDAKHEAQELARIEETERVVEEEALAEEQRRTDAAAIAQAEQRAATLVAASASSNSSSSSSGAAATPAYAAGGSYLGTYTITAYCGCAQCCGKTNGITASGTQATANRTVAADSSLPFGTQIVIGGQVYTVEDRGGAITGNRIDIYFNTHQEALNFGRKTMEVYLNN